MLEPGLYDKLITRALAPKLDEGTVLGQMDDPCAACVLRSEMHGGLKASGMSVNACRNFVVEPPEPAVLTGEIGLAAQTT